MFKEVTHSIFDEYNPAIRFVKPNKYIDTRQLEIRVEYTTFEDYVFIFTVNSLWFCVEPALSELKKYVEDELEIRNEAIKNG